MELPCTVRIWKTVRIGPAVLRGLWPAPPLDPPGWGAGASAVAEPPPVLKWFVTSPITARPTITAKTPMMRISTALTPVLPPRGRLAGGRDGREDWERRTGRAGRFGGFRGGVCCRACGRVCGAGPRAAHDLEAAAFWWPCGADRRVGVPGWVWLSDGR